MTELTLVRRRSTLADPAEQTRMLAAAAHLPVFAESLACHGESPLAAQGIEVLQINVGKVCNHGVNPIGQQLVLVLLFLHITNRASG